MNLSKRLRTIVLKDDTRAGRTFDLFIQLLIIVSVIEFSIETMPHVDERIQIILNWIELTVVLIFTAEYILRVFLTENPFRYIFSGFGIVDLVSILPFYLGVGLDLRSVRAIRLVRIFRLLKFARYSKAMAHYRRAFAMIREELVIYLFAVAITIYLASVGIWFFEHEAQPESFASIFHAVWWSITTLTTVGYGDVYPITVGGKAFTGIIVIAGIGLVALPSGLFATALTEARKSVQDLDNSGDDAS